MMMMVMVIIMVVVVAMVAVMDYEELLPMKPSSATSTIPRCSSFNMLSTSSCSTRLFYIIIHIFSIIGCIIYLYNYLRK